MHRVLQRSFISTSLESWARLAKYELLIPHLFLWMNIDLTPVVFYKCTPTSSKVGHWGFLFNIQFWATGTLTQFFLVTLPVAPPDVLVKNGIYREVLAMAVQQCRTTFLVLCWVSSESHEVKLGEASKGSCSFGTQQIQWPLWLCSKAV